MVQSHGVRGVAANLAPMTIGSSSMVGGWGTSGLHGRLHAFVKRALLEQLVSPGAAVCDLFCGRGSDTSNWAQVGIGKYIGIDLSASALEEAREQWEKYGQSLPATFQELDPCTGNLEILQDAGLPVDVVSCFAHLQDYFASEGMVRLLLKNVVSLLKPGGYFFGFTPDSSTIWYKYQKAVEEAMKVGSLRVNGTLPRVRSPLYTITFEDDRFQFFGSKYQLRFVDGLPAQMQQLVHFPSFIRLAEEVGLEYVEIQNLTEFYDDYRVPFASTLQSSCKNLLDQKGQPMVDSRGKLSAVATDVLSLYSTFIFKKSTRIIIPAISSRFHFETDLEESSLKSDSTPTISNRCKLPLDSSQEVIPSRTKHKEIFSSNGEEYAQDHLLDTARPERDSSDADVNDSTSPSNRAESNLKEIVDTPNHGQPYSLTQGNMPSDVDCQQYFHGVDRFLENRSSSSVDRDGSVSPTPSEDFEFAQQQFLDAHELYTGRTALSSDERDDHSEDELVQDEKSSIRRTDTANPTGTALANESMDSRRSPTHLCRSVFTTNDSEMTGQTCSVNYQSEVEQEPISPQLEITIPAPPPFRFYQRKRRSETRLEVVAEANLSTNAASIRALRPRRSRSVGDSKLVLGGS